MVLKKSTHIILKYLFLLFFVVKITGFVCDEVSVFFDNDEITLNISLETDTNEEEKNESDGEDFVFFDVFEKKELIVKPLNYYFFVNKQFTEMYSDYTTPPPEMA